MRDNDNTTIYIYIYVYMYTSGTRKLPTKGSFNLHHQGWFQQ